MTIRRKPRTCASCTFYAPFLATLGECTQYIRARQRALAADLDTRTFDQRWPQRAAPDVTPDDGCDKWAPKP